MPILIQRSEFPHTLEGPWALIIDDLSALRDALPDYLLVPLIQALAQVEKLRSIADLISNVRGKGIRADSNRNFLAESAAGAIQQLQGVVRDLHTAGIRSYLSTEGENGWLKAKEILNMNPLIGEIRHQMSAHPGEPKEIKSGLESLIQRGVKIPLFQGEGPSHIETRTPLARIIIQEALGITSDLGNFESAMEDVVEIHTTFIVEFMTVIEDLLQFKGVKLRRIKLTTPC